MLLVVLILWLSKNHCFFERSDSFPNPYRSWRFYSPARLCSSTLFTRKTPFVLKLNAISVRGSLAATNQPPLCLSLHVAFHPVTNRNVPPFWTQRSPFVSANCLTQWFSKFYFILRAYNPQNCQFLLNKVTKMIFANISHYLVIVKNNIRLWIKQTLITSVIVRKQLVLAYCRHSHLNQARCADFHVLKKSNDKILRFFHPEISSPIPY